jgi:hypothetical protein
MEKAKEGKTGTRTEKEQIHKEALERFELVRKDDQREKAVNDLLFLAAEDGQWEQYQRENRGDRPRYTIDRISGPKDQVIGDQRQTRTGGIVIPQNGGEKETARVLTGLIRNIEQTQGAASIYDVAFDEQLTCGYGGWRYLTEFDEDTFEQIITMEPIKSAPSSYYWDPAAKKYDKSDSMWQFLVSYISKELFKDQWPDATEQDFDIDVYSKNYYSHWFRKDGIRIAEYWRKRPIKKNIGLLSDGRVIDLDEDGAIIDELAEQDVTVLKQREVDSHKVEMCVMNGAELLTDMQPWAGKYIPMVPVFGKTATVDGKDYTWGIVRKSKDAQRIYNYGTSTAIESTALSPKSPVIMATEQIAGHEREWQTFNTKNPPVMTYKNIAGVQAPFRLEAPVVQQSLLLQIQQSKEDIFATTGIEPPALGQAVPELKSGKAIEASNAMGDRGTFSYQDNLEKSKKFGYEILVDLIPRTYDTARIVKIMGDDEELEDVKINEEIVDQETGETVLVNDLSKGKYGVLVKSGPAFATKREQSLDQLIKLMEFSPDDAPALTDLAVDNMDLVKSEVAMKRIRKRQIDQGLIEPTEEEIKEYGLDQGPPPDPMNEALVENVKMQTEELMAKIKLTDEKIQSETAKSQKAYMDALVAFKKEIREQIAAGIPVSDEDGEVLEGQQAIVQEEQEDVLENQEIAGSLPMDAKGLPIPEEALPPEGVGGPTGPTGPQPGPDLPVTPNPLP